MSPEAQSGSDPDAGSMRFETAVEELESIIGRIESGELELEESMTLHRRGQILLKICRERLETAEQELQTVSLDDEALSGDDPGQRRFGLMPMTNLAFSLDGSMLWQHLPWAIFVFCLGACVGSFINVVVHRMPVGMSLLYPPSRCPTCGGRLRFFRENLPILGWGVPAGSMSHV